MTGLFDGTSGIRILTPGQCIGAGTTADAFSHRFQEEEIRRHVARDVSRHEKILKGYIEKAKLEHWSAATKELAEHRIQEEEASRQGVVGKVGDLVEAIQAAQVRPNKEAKKGVRETIAPGNWLEAVQRGLGL